MPKPFLRLYFSEAHYDRFHTHLRAGRGRVAAAERKLPVVGTIGILERAAELGLLDLKETFILLKSTTFFVSAALLEQALARHYKR